MQAEGFCLKIPFPARIAGACFEVPIRDHLVMRWELFSWELFLNILVNLFNFSPVKSEYASTWDSLCS